MKKTFMLFDVKAGTYSGKLMVVKDPSRLFVGTVPESSLKRAGQLLR